MKYYKDFLIVCIIIIFSLGLIILLFQNEDKFIDKELIELKNKVNVSNGEYITKCYNGSYYIIKPTDFFECGNLRKDITLEIK